MKLDLGYYLARGGDVVLVDQKNNDSIWPFVGYYVRLSILEDEEMFAWTGFGAYSDEYDYGMKPNSKFNHKKDLIKAISREKDPEYFL